MNIENIYKKMRMKLPDSIEHRAKIWYYNYIKNEINKEE